ncbi:hypothetical protein HMPREF1144_4551 [Klebsiella sp. OBRC7]|nr:hypothetical protein HMPREF1144_4551 [Klebsiella sp. OBRC7]
MEKQWRSIQIFYGENPMTKRCEDICFTGSHFNPIMNHDVTFIDLPEE